MPSVPIDNPSLTPTVLKRRPTSPAACTPSLTLAASRSRCMLQVLPSYHMLQIPTWAFCKSASVRPMPYSIACDAPWLRGCVTRDEYLFIGNSAGSTKQDPAHICRVRAPTDVGRGLLFGAAGSKPS